MSRGRVSWAASWIWGAWSRAKQSECSSLLTGVKRSNQHPHISSIRYDNEPKLFLLYLHLSKPSEKTNKGLLTSCRLQQRTQLCRNHQVCDVDHLPLSQLLETIIKKYFNRVPVLFDKKKITFMCLLLSNSLSWSLSHLLSFPPSFKLPLQQTRHNSNQNYWFWYSCLPFNSI